MNTDLDHKNKVNLTMNRYFLLFSIIVTTQMIGCTAILWNNNSGNLYELNTGKAFSTHTETEIVDQDQIIGFAYLKENASSKNSQDLKNTDTSIIVVGQKYAYKIGSFESKKILDAIRSDLDPEYWRIRPVCSGDNHFRLFLLPAIKFQKNAQAVKFSGDIELYYAKNNLTQYEGYKLTLLGFDRVIQDKEAVGFYRKKTGLSGEVVGLNPEIKKMKFQSFSQNYEITVYADGKAKYKLHPKVFLAKVALTPVTLAGDLVAVPLYFLFNIGR